MSNTEPSKELDETKVREILGTIPNYILDYLELSDNIKEEWRKGATASDFGGHQGFITKYEQAILDWHNSQLLLLIKRIEDEVIGGDDTEVRGTTQSPLNPIYWTRKTKNRNQLRATQRQALNKLLGEYMPTGLENIQSRQCPRCGHPHFCKG